MPPEKAFLFLTIFRVQEYDPFEIAETDHNTWAIFEVEPSLFVAALCSKSWLPRHVSHASLRGLLLHTRNLMAILMGGIQWTLDKASANGVILIACVDLFSFAIV